MLFYNYTIKSLFRGSLQFPSQEPRLIGWFRITFSNEIAQKKKNE
jgi:hypothetical protein